MDARTEAQNQVNPTPAVLSPGHLAHLGSAVQNTSPRGGLTSRSNSSGCEQAAPTPTAPLEQHFESEETMSEDSVYYH